LQLELVHPKMTIMSPFTHPQEFDCSKMRRYFEECCR